MWRAVLLLWLLAPAGDAAHAVQRYFAARNSPSGPPCSRHSLRAAEEQADGIETSGHLREEAVERSGEGKTSGEGPMAAISKSVPFGAAGNQLRNLKRAASSVLKTYDAVFQADDEDIRTDFKNSYDIWPFFYQSLYEYEPKKSDIDFDKANDKRFAIPSLEKVIPVYEKIDETTENKINSGQYLKHTKAGSTDNPIFGNQPFFSYVLNDYFDNTEDDDPTTFKGLSWGKDFDHEMSLQDIDDYAKRIRRLEEDTPKLNKEENATKSNMYMGLDTTHDSINSKARESQSSEKGDDDKHKYDGRYQYDRDNYEGFRDFADSFAHRFGLEEHDRESKYAKKNNADKGEKKKGFRTVYHKDEYQEHRDFFDNSDNSENAEDKGSSKAHIGGSEAFLRSLSDAVTGSEENSLKNKEHIAKNHFERKHEDKERSDEIERELDQYRDVAKRTALSNNADYVDRYML